MEKRQQELDKIKWDKSIAIGRDACGTFEYCAKCDKSLKYPCAEAYAKTFEVKNASACVCVVCTPEICKSEECDGINCALTECSCETKKPVKTCKKTTAKKSTIAADKKEAKISKKTTTKKTATKKATEKTTKKTSAKK